MSSLVELGIQTLNRIKSGKGLFWKHANENDGASRDETEGCPGQVTWCGRPHPDQAPAPRPPQPF